MTFRDEINAALKRTAAHPADDGIRFTQDPADILARHAEEVKTVIWTPDISRDLREAIEVIDTLDLPVKYDRDTPYLSYIIHLAGTTAMTPWPEYIAQPLRVHIDRMYQAYAASEKPGSPPLEATLSLYAYGRDSHHRYYYDVDTDNNPFIACNPHSDVCENHAHVTFTGHPDQTLLIFPEPPRKGSYTGGEPAPSHEDGIAVAPGAIAFMKGSLGSNRQVHAIARPKKDRQRISAGMFAR